MSKDKWLNAGVVSVLIMQMALLLLSFDALWMISIFCTSTKLPWLENFGFIHLAYLGLVVLGVASILSRRGRLGYIIAASISLLALPAQAWLVMSDYLYCDAP